MSLSSLTSNTVMLLPRRQSLHTSTFSLTVVEAKEKKINSDLRDRNNFDSSHKSSTILNIPTGKSGRGTGEGVHFEVCIS